MAARNNQSLAILTGALACTAGMAWAVPLMNIDLEGDTVGATIAVGAAVPGGVSSHPTVMDLPGTTSAVVRSSSDVGQFYSGFGGANNRLVVFTDSDSASSYEMVFTSARVDVGGTMQAIDAESWTRPLQVTFDALVDAGTGHWNNVQWRLQSVDGKILGGLLMQSESVATFRWLQYNSGTFVNIVPTNIQVDEGVAHHYALELYPDGTLTVRQDGATSGDGVFSSTWYTGAPVGDVRLDRFRFGGNNNHVGRVAMDNITMGPVPEPTALAALGIAGLFLVRRRRA